MAEISEYGDVMLNAYIDEWGRRRIEGLLEDGVKVIVAAGIILKQWSQIGYLSHVARRPYRSIKLTQSLNQLHIFIRHHFVQLTQTLQTRHTWTVEYPTLILKEWFATLQTTHVFTCPAKVARLLPFLQLSHNFSKPSRTIFLFARLRMLHEFYAAKPSVKRTGLFLVLGDLAIQLSND